MTLPPRSSRTCRHDVPIGGVVHQVQSRLVGSAPARVDSSVSIGGRVVVERSVSLDSDELPQDPVGVTRVLEDRQRSTIRGLVEARRAQLAAQRVPGADTDRTDGYPGRNRGLAEARLRRRMIRYARGVARLVDGDSSASEKLESLVHESAILLADEDHRSRSREIAELHLLRAEAVHCLERGDDRACQELLVGEFARMADDLQKVNDRASLRAFDLATLEGVDRRVKKGSDDAALGEEAQQALLLVWGRDQQLDEHMALRSDLRAGDIRAPLRRTLQRLRREVEADTKGI